VAKNCKPRHKVKENRFGKGMDEISVGTKREEESKLRKVDTWESKERGKGQQQG